MLYKARTDVNTITQRQREKKGKNVGNDEKNMLRLNLIKMQCLE